MLVWWVDNVTFIESESNEISERKILGFKFRPVHMRVRVVVYFIGRMKYSRKDIVLKEYQKEIERGTI